MTQGNIVIEAQNAEVNMPPRSYIEAMNRPIVVYILYTMVSAQLTNLCLKMLRAMMPFSPKKDIGYMQPLRNT